MFGPMKSFLHGMGARAAGRPYSLRGATAWLNSPPLTEEGLRGKVVLVDFCRSKPAALKQPLTGTTCSLRKPIWARIAPSASPPSAVR
jgi:hypothetical protein